MRLGSVRFGMPCLELRLPYELLQTPLAFGSAIGLNAPVERCAQALSEESLDPTRFPAPRGNDEAPEPDPTHSAPSRAAGKHPLLDPGQTARRRAALQLLASAFR